MQEAELGNGTVTAGVVLRVWTESELRLEEKKKQT